VDRGHAGRYNRQVTRDDLFDRLHAGLTPRWHWYRWHFGTHGLGRPVPFVDALLDALLAADAAMPGYAARMADTLIQIGGREKDHADYEQLLQALAEVHIAAHVALAPWPAGTSFADEPVAPGSARNPELVVSTPDGHLGVEVKAPRLLDHEAMRKERPLQAGGRIFTPDQLASMAGGKDKVTLPRDNPVKDFLISADGKFASFRAEDPDFRGVLVIVWDDYVYEPLTALLHPGSGLLTDASFARDGDGPLRFPNVDAIVVLSHLQYLRLALAEDGGPNAPFVMSDRAFDWRMEPARPAALIFPPDGRGLPEDVPGLLDLVPLEDIHGAEYQASDMVQWIAFGAGGGGDETDEPEPAPAG
jgi:hypothetical protein